ncbi:S41 family peptidase [Aliidiomarina celeris]|uniref:S41 family peptidase n=1 Tax=Aliidiomarina celeris TaxID=2249428 RepID=UPI000DE9C60A|nr:S41 family peptidase [Aliidiomarina celeris]
MKRKILPLSALSLLIAGCSTEDLPQLPTVDVGASQCSQQAKNVNMFNFMQSDYLWNDEIPSGIQPRSYASLNDLLNAMRSPRDRFSFLLTEQEYLDRYVNAVFFGYGLSRQDRPDLGVMQIRYVYEDSPAAEVGLSRGDQIIEANGVAMAEWYSRIEAGSATIDDIFGPNEEGVSVDLQWRDPNGVISSATITKREVETNTVMHTQRQSVNGSEVGYFVFDTFINRSEADLNRAFDQLDGVDELVVDLRYNGGGLIRVANQLASQVAWHEVQNQTFVTYQYNSNYQSNSVPFNLGAGITRLNLDRVYVLTTGASCSSSELVINSLSPFVEVITIGEPTCGKPVGQSPRQFCDEILYSINFQTLNADGFGDYFDGLPVNCAASDTIVADWGDNADPLLATAYTHIQTGQCAADGVAALSRATSRSVATGNPVIDKFRKEH